MIDLCSLKAYEEMLVVAAASAEFLLPQTEEDDTGTSSAVGGNKLVEWTVQRQREKMAKYP